MYREVKQALSNIERLFGLIDESQEVRDKPGRRSLVQRQPSLSFDNVRFAYDVRREILHGIACDSAGKTSPWSDIPAAASRTLARLLYRFRRQRRRHSHRRPGSARSDPGSVRAAIGNRSAGPGCSTTDPLQHWIRAAEAPKPMSPPPPKRAHPRFHRIAAGRLRSAVGERGLKLSAERSNAGDSSGAAEEPGHPDLDEATSALIRRAKSHPGRIGRIAVVARHLMIAHRLSTVMDADEIIVLDQGNIVERGTHASLQAMDGPTRGWGAAAAVAGQRSRIGRRVQ